MDQSVYEQATAEMSQRRQRACAENDRRIREINRDLPQIREINDTLYRTGRELIGLIAGAGGKDISQEIEKIRRCNLDAQAMSRSLLRENGYPEDYLDVQYTCKECSDTGSVDGKVCQCFRRLCGRIAADKLNKKTCLTLCSFDTFDLSFYDGEFYQQMKHTYEYCLSYAENFTEGADSILMTGRTGLGKTHLSLSIANKVLDKGYSVIYDSAVNLLGSIEEQHFSRDHSSETLDLVLDCDLLILDDLGTEYESQFYNSTIYNIVNTRLGRRKPTIISTNMGLDAIRRRYDERMVSRLMTMYTVMNFLGEDIRLQKKRLGIL